MRFSRERQEKISDLIMRALGRGLCAVSMFDKRVASELDQLGDGFSFSICIGLDGSYIKLTVSNGRLEYLDGDKNKADIVIAFKDLTGAWPVLIGQTSIAKSFAEHRILIYGDLSTAVALTRVIDISQAYLFPQFILKKYMRSLPLRQVPRLFVYVAMIFVREALSDSPKTSIDSCEVHETQTVA